MQKTKVSLFNFYRSGLLRMASVKRELSSTDGSDATEVSAKEPRIEEPIAAKKAPKRKKMAVLTVYSGKGYYGVQINPGFPTIESELVKALHAAELIEQKHVDDMAEMWFQRASRTDKGVSAAGQVFSMLMRPDRPTAPELINSHLPPQIRVVGIIKATKGFDSKNHCSNRSYEYLTPTFAFAPVEEQTTEDYRISEEQLKLVNECLQLFKGTHNFHNFTSRRKYSDPSSKRYMMSLEAGEPFVKDGIEYFVITIRGQSFMLHQIRKMIGLTIAMSRGVANKSTLELCWGPDRVDIPKAPGLGLLLDKLYYDVYNKKFGRDGVHEAIDWTAYKDVIERFKKDYIYADIMQTEKAEKSMLEWLKNLMLHSYQVCIDKPDSPVESEDEGDKSTNVKEPIQTGPADDTSSNVTHTNSEQPSVDQLRVPLTENSNDPTSTTDEKHQTIEANT